MANIRSCLLLGSLFVMTLFSTACKGGVGQQEIIADAKKYLALADAGDPKAYQRLSSAAKKYITEAAFTERMKAEPGIERRGIEVVGASENQALVQYEVKYGSGPWERETGFYSKEPNGWMRAFSRQLIGEYEDAQKQGLAAEEAALLRLIEVEPNPAFYLALCSLHYKRGDNDAGERACRSAVQYSERFPTKGFRETGLLALEVLALRADDGAASVRAASEALGLLGKNSDLSRDREASFRLARLVAHLQRLQGQGKLSKSEWGLLEEDWVKLQALCAKGPCAGLGKQVKNLASGVEGILAQRPSSAPSTADSQPRGLGGGYKGIRWGSTQKQVVQALGMQPSETSSEAVTFKYGAPAESKELTCLFHQGAFFGALFRPGLSDGDQHGAIAIQQALVEKYGKPKELSGLVDGILGMPLIAFEWEDGETRIRYTIMDPEKLEEGLRSVGGGRGRLGYPSSTVKVAYSSIALLARKNQEENQAKARAESEEQQRKRAKFAGDL